MIMSYRNFEAVTIRGLDLSLAYFPADHWRLTGNLTYQLPIEQGVVL